MKNLTLLFVSLFLIFSCSEEENLPSNPFVVAFEQPSTNFPLDDSSETISLIFSETPSANGFVEITFENSDSEYGVDFNTTPTVENGKITLPFTSGQSSIQFTFNSLLNEANEENQNKTVLFKISQISYTGQTSIQGNSEHLVSFQTRLGGTEIPNIGGPNEQNQAYFDLSTGQYAIVQRDSWDLGFYAGDEFRVILNSSIYMAARATESTNIDEVTTSTIPDSWFQEVAIGTFNPASEEFIDHPSGNLNLTAIDEISINENENKVYLVNLGYEVGTETPNNGSIAIAGDVRGWKKIRIIRNGENYLLQFADLDDTTHQEISITKNSNYNFNFFSFNSNSEVSVQPPKLDWDLNFTVFTNLIEGAGSYGFSDFVTNNIWAEVSGFMVTENNEITYENYHFNENEASSQLTDDQRIIGGNWRDVFSDVYHNRFFVIKDTEGNWYKIKFLAFKNETGERGHPKFQYQLLQSAE